MTTCQANRWSDEACESGEPGAVALSYLPAHLAETARAAGSERGLRKTILVCAGCAAWILEHDASARRDDR